MSERQDGRMGELSADFWHRRGDVSQIAGRDVYPDGKVEHGLFNRAVNFDLSPKEHWDGAGDDMAWAGWAGYAGYAAPPSLVTYDYPSQLTAGEAVAAIRWFYHNAAPVGAVTRTMYVRAAISYSAGAGIMIDDGVDAGDGQGANNFYRAFVYSPVGGGLNHVIRVQFRIGGGALTTADYYSFSPQFMGIVMAFGTGAPWANWGVGVYHRNETCMNRLVRWDGGAGFTWTPTRVGIYGESGAAGEDKAAHYDWYHENW